MSHELAWLEHVNVAFAVILALAVVCARRCVAVAIEISAHEAPMEKPRASAASLSIEDWPVLNAVIDDLLCDGHRVQHEQLPLVGEGLALAMLARYHLSPYLEPPLMPKSLSSSCTTRNAVS
ncbi:hypothetical protein ACHHYP_15170 [Achlya hypogyna]|uniref:Uncharacterized protein n=1 Tax=Achlya hypogyna TaxID=1202772 RepID=A0A1V9YBH3_ACHHY|nr:hypothetical protein ACHHYP_15170 [Achlya hypogyna]